MECNGSDKNPLNLSAKFEGGKRCRPYVADRRSKLPSISIVTAVYNANSTIEAAIRSVICQTYDNFEFIIIDGGSSDGTIEKLLQYNDQIDYWISEPDKGVYDALNKGIELAMGEWIYFLGSDDMLIDNQVLSRIFAKRPRGNLIYGNVLWGDTGKVYDGVFSKEKLIWDNICQQAIFYHRKLFRMMGKFDLQYPLLADWVFNMRAFAKRLVTPCYTDTIVARYSLCGLSSKKTDESFLANRELLIYKTFGFRYYHRLINPDYSDLNGGLHCYWQDITYHLKYLNSHRHTLHDQLSVAYDPLVLRFLSRTYNFVNTTLPQIWCNFLQFVSHIVRIALPLGSIRRRSVTKTLHFFSSFFNKPLK